MDTKLDIMKGVNVGFGFNTLGLKIGNDSISIVEVRSLVLSYSDCLSVGFTILIFLFNLDTSKSVLHFF